MLFDSVGVAKCVQGVLAVGVTRTNEWDGGERTSEEGTWVGGCVR